MPKNDIFVNLCYKELLLVLFMFKDHTAEFLHLVDAGKKTHAIVLTMGFSMQALMLVLQAFRGNQRYYATNHSQWVLLSMDGAEVVCDLGIHVMPYASIDSNYNLASVTLLTGENNFLSPVMSVFLKKQLNRGALLAILGEKAETIKLFHYESARKPWITCHDTMLISTLVYRLFNEKNLNNHNTHKLDNRLINTITLMKNNTEEPLALKEIAFHLGISKRHTERLFRKYLNTTPAKYYLNIRLWKAKKMLQRTKTPIIQVSTACGFVSASHFSRAYTNYFNIAPSHENNRRTLPESELNQPSLKQHSG